MERTRLLKSLIYGLVPHVALLLILFHTPKPERKTIPRAIPLTVTIQTTQKMDETKVPEVRERRQKEKRSGEPGARKKAPSVTQASLSPSTSSSNSPHPGSKTYSSLLPTPSDIAVVEASRDSGPDGISSSRHHWSQSLNIEGKRTLLSNAGNLRGLIHIPLSARSVMETGKATARIKRDRASQSLILLILQGEPLLRALLFERLQSPTAKEAIVEVLQTLAAQELVVALHLVKGAHLQANDDQFSWRDNRLDIYLTQGRRGFTPRGLHSQEGLSVGFTLPDEKADRQKEQDEAEYARLKHSPAFLSVLTDRKL